MSQIATFFTSYSARRSDDPERIEVIAIVLEGDGDRARLRLVVVGQDGRAQLANADEVDLYGAYEEVEADE
jgi:hypothetical protein